MSGKNTASVQHSDIELLDKLSMAGDHDGLEMKKLIKYCDTKNNSNWNVFDLLTCLKEISLLLAVSF